MKTDTITLTNRSKTIVSILKDADYGITSEELVEGRLTEFSREVEVNDLVIEYDIDITRYANYEEETDSYRVKQVDVDVIMKGIWFNEEIVFLDDVHALFVETAIELAIKNNLS